MPEFFTMLACDMNSGCEWNETEWRKAVLQDAKRRGRQEGEPEITNDVDMLDYSIAHNHLQPGYVEIVDPRYLLRPEAIESVFIHYRLTGDSDLPDAAWRLFQAIEKHTRTEFANAMINHVTVSATDKVNKTESFWLAETLKFFYLIFSEPSVVCLDGYVLQVPIFCGLA